MERPVAGASGQAGSPDPALQASWFLKLLVVLFTLSYTTFALWILVDLWARDQTFVLGALSISREKLDPVFVHALHTIVGALLGSGVLDLVSFHTYSAVKRDFQKSHVPGYFYGPWLAATVGLIIFCLLQSGLFVFSGGTQGTASAESNSARMGYISVGFLSGFGWMNAVEKIREVVVRFFSRDAPVKRQTTSPGKVGAGGEAAPALDQADQPQPSAAADAGGAGQQPPPAADPEKKPDQTS